MDASTNVHFESDSAPASPKDVVLKIVPAVERPSDPIEALVLKDQQRMAQLIRLDRARVVQIFPDYFQLEFPYEKEPSRQGEGGNLQPLTSVKSLKKPYHFDEKEPDPVPLNEGVQSMPLENGIKTDQLTLSSLKNTDSVPMVERDDVKLPPPSVPIKIKKDQSALLNMIRGKDRQKMAEARQFEIASNRQMLENLGHRQAY